MLIKKLILLIVLLGTSHGCAATNDESSRSLAVNTDTVALAAKADAVVVATVVHSSTVPFIANFMCDWFGDFRITSTVCGRAPESKLLRIVGRVPFEAWQSLAARAKQGEKVILFLSSVPGGHDSYTLIAVPDGIQIYTDSAAERIRKDYRETK